MVREVYQEMGRPISEWPDGPSVVLVCNKQREMELLSERVLEKRAPMAYLNMDTTVRPAVFSLFLDVIDEGGIDLSEAERISLLAMMNPDAESMADGRSGKLVRVLFGNHVDVTPEQQQHLIGGMARFRRLNVLVGYHVAEGEALHVRQVKPGENTFQIFAFDAPAFTEYPYLDFQKNLLAYFKSGS